MVSINLEEELRVTVRCQKVSRLPTMNFTKYEWKAKDQEVPAEVAALVKSEEDTITRLAKL